MQITAEKKVLIVEDDLLMQKLLGKLLSNMGFCPMATSQGHEALHLLMHEEISLVITDLNMPSMSGHELCKAIRAKDFQHYIYIIVITSQSDSQSLADTMQAGADDFISKPLNPAELTARLKSALRVLELEASLNHRNQKLNLTLNQIKLEQDEAKSTLLGVLPQPQHIGAVSFNWFFEASSFIGGDIFDYFPVGNDHLCFYMVDVAGHGVMAALQAFTVYNDLLSAQVGFERKINAGQSLAAIASTFMFDYNNQFLEKKRNDCYFTMFFGLLNTQSGEVALVQAGHPAALYIDADMTTVQIVGDGGLPIGLVENANYESIVMQLKLGARLCIYSDGVTDCENNESEFFGQQRWMQVFHEAYSMDLQGALTSMEGHLKGWRSNQASYKDDVSCLILEYDVDQCLLNKNSDDVLGDG